MTKKHNYRTTVEWTGNKGKGTSGYKEFERSHIVSIDKKPDILCSSDPAFRGDRTKYNPEELLLASLSSCHMLWYLHLCSESKIIVTEYLDNATGIMIETSNGSGYFLEVTLNPKVVVAESSMMKKAVELHKKANELCFIANSVSFKVNHYPSCSIA
ncbi:OsmC family protein [Flagellimonas meridianipacifica]|uniref:Organic hydroperoxide reductase OsmC/OhrA n=1 Tax=Flagellimonas meridianipacifica TaxID=1080225 RepID=A0A2T0M8U1_9FLAO|nr:OsmC family protein [Allomuricauda pacifica]PRX53956.1 organic hydroperoxide reductase OsmC/OhrA [Allomuricauda pacifica]